MESNEVKKTAASVEPEIENISAQTEPENEEVTPQTGEPELNTENPAEETTQQPEDNEVVGLSDSTPVEAAESEETPELHDEVPFEHPEEDLDDDLFSDEHTEQGEPVHDYSSYNKPQLINTLRRLIGELAVEEVRLHAEAIKSCYYKLRNQEIAAQKEAYIAEGHDEVLFVPESDPNEQELKDLFKEYRNLRYEQNKKQEAVKEENYHKKVAIIEELKALVKNDESLNNTFPEFNELQNRWKAIGQVPQNKVKDLWETYHYQVELFYDFVKINRELRDLDLRRNLELKNELCQKAEEIAANENDAQTSFKELQKLHEAWREIGPVPREQKQLLWDKFKAATVIINKRYQQFYEVERNTQKEQLQKKVELCEKAEELAGFVSDNPREWNDVTEKVIALQEEWKKTGYGPRKENAKIWERFRAANDAFFQSKRTFWNKSKEQLTGNMALKVEICEQAEKLKDSDDWKATTDKLIALQKKWKEIGPVPRKQSEIIWKRFRTACDEFFNRKTNHFSGVTGNQDENYKVKKALVAEIEAFVPSEDASLDLLALKKFQERWAEIGFVPFRKKEELQNKYHEAIDKQFEKLKINEQDLGLMKFKSKVEHWASMPRGWSKINAERDRYAQKIKQIETDINTLANNVGFLGSSEGAQSLVQNVNAQIDRLRSQIEYLKSKIKVIDNQDEIN